MDYATGAAFAKDNNMLFFETSALENKNIDLAFEKVVEEVDRRIENDFYNLENNVWK